MLRHIPKWVDQLLQDEEAKETDPNTGVDIGEEDSDKNAAAEETTADEAADLETGSDEETAAAEKEDVPMRRYPVTRRRPPPDRYGFDQDDQV